MSKESELLATVRAEIDHNAYIEEHSGILVIPLKGLRWSLIPSYKNTDHILQDIKEYIAYREGSTVDSPKEQSPLSVVDRRTFVATILLSGMYGNRKWTVEDRDVCEAVRTADLLIAELDK